MSLLGLASGPMCWGQEAIKELLPFLWDQGLNTHISPRARTWIITLLLA